MDIKNGLVLLINVLQRIGDAGFKITDEFPQRLIMPFRYFLALAPGLIFKLKKDFVEFFAFFNLSVRMFFCTCCLGAGKCVLPIR